VQWAVPSLHRRQSSPDALERFCLHRSDRCAHEKLHVGPQRVPSSSRSVIRERAVIADHRRRRAGLFVRSRDGCCAQTHRRGGRLPCTRNHWEDACHLACWLPKSRELGGAGERAGTVRAMAAECCRAAPTLNSWTVVRSGRGLARSAGSVAGLAQPRARTGLLGAVRELTSVGVCGSGLNECVVRCPVSDQNLGVRFPFVPPSHSSTAPARQQPTA